MGHEITIPFVVLLPPHPGIFCFAIIITTIIINNVIKKSRSNRIATCRCVGEAKNPWCIPCQKVQFQEDSVHFSHNNSLDSINRFCTRRTFNLRQNCTKQQSHYYKVLLSLQNFTSIKTVTVKKLDYFTHVYFTKVPHYSIYSTSCV